MFCSEQFSVSRFTLRSGDALLLSTDGVTEAENDRGVEYGSDRLRAVAAGASGRSSAELVSACVDDITAFLAGSRCTDDVTLMAVRRE
jgi:serine phosphatase RsbU (regulator of sigma subunit)